MKERKKDMTSYEQAMAMMAIIDELRGMTDGVNMIAYYAGTATDEQRATYAEAYDEIGIDVVNDIADDYFATQK